ncbi:hypothetical protein TNCV_1710241 [Trichonephila clavipes]|nr:hypothetical protein TNCV_1710241 [Trichonephila clavipes]
MFHYPSYRLYPLAIAQSNGKSTAIKATRKLVWDADTEETFRCSFLRACTVCSPRDYNVFPKRPARSFGLDTPYLEDQVLTPNTWLSDLKLPQ